LLALSLTIRATLLGRRGFVEVAERCVAKANYLAARIRELSGYSLAFAGAPSFNEFCVRVRGGSAARVCEKLESDGIIAGYDLGRADAALADRLLVAVTEKHRREDLDRFVQALDRA
jgi:glycine dehydrogenase subunit 1